MTDQRPVTEATATPITLPDAQTVTSVQHWTDRLFSFRVTRPASLRFRSGEFVMIGLLGDNGKPLLRAYSIASPAWDDELEFYSIKVPDFATGTGIAPFASLMREPDTFERYEQVIMMHTCRDVAELEYGRQLVENIKSDEMLAELFGEGFADKLLYYPTTTREESPHMGRITDNLTSGKAFADLGIPGINPAEDRGMVCGSLAFNTDMKTVLEGFGLEEGANSDPKQYVVEKAFVGDGI